MWLSCNESAYVNNSRWISPLRIFPFREWQMVRWHIAKHGMYFLRLSINTHSFSELGTWQKDVEYATCATCHKSMSNTPTIKQFAFIMHWSVGELATLNYCYMCLKIILVFPMMTPFRCVKWCNHDFIFFSLVNDMDSNDTYPGLQVHHTSSKPL